MNTARTWTSTACVLAAGLLAGCEAGPGGFGPIGAGLEAETFTPITTEAEFREQVVGREVVYENGAIGTYGGDNTWEISDDEGVVASGTWVWRDDRWCYGGSTAGTPVQIRCDEVAVSETGVRFTREEGTSGVLRFRT